jgi:hypothetical protein
MGQPDRFEELERAYRADMAARLPALAENVKQLVGDVVRQCAALRSDHDGCCGPELLDFVAWLRQLQADDVLFRSLAGFSSFNWAGILERYFDFDVGCDSFGLTVVNDFCFRQQPGPTASDHRQLLHLIIIDALGFALSTLWMDDDLDVAEVVT